MEPTVSGVGVLDKAMALVAIVERGPANLGELTAESGFSRATTHRLALALESHAMFRRDRDGRFILGARLIGLGRAAATGFPIATVAVPILTALRDATGESVQLYVAEGDQRRALVALDSPHELRTIVAPGALLPLGRGSAGRLLAGEAAGAEGWVETVGDRAPGVASVSAPVVDVDGAVVGAVSVSGPIERIGRTPGAVHGAEVVTAAATIAAALS